MSIPEDRETQVFVVIEQLSRAAKHLREAAEDNAAQASRVLSYMAAGALYHASGTQHDLAALARVVDALVEIAEAMGVPSELRDEAISGSRSARRLTIETMEQLS